MAVNENVDASDRDIPFDNRKCYVLSRLVYISDGNGIGIRSGSSVTITRKSKNGVVSRIGSVTESESEGSVSEGFLFLV